MGDLTVNEGDFVIKFHCKSCGQKISVPKIHAGKRGKCPKCKSIVVVPKVEDTRPVASQINSILDIPQKSKAASQPTSQEGVSDGTLEDLQRFREKLGIEKAGPVVERKLPWLIDIFLYPLSKSGLTILGIVITVPFLLHALVKFLGLFTLVFPPMLVFFAAFAIIRLIVSFVLVLYMYWYVCECIRDSADGGLRAPETLGSTPGLGELLWQFLKIGGCLAFFSLPILVYYFSHTRGFDMIFWVLCACSIFFFPMGLLSVIIFDSLRGLNPILIIGSIFSTFFQYCGLVIFFYALSLLVTAMVYILPQSWILGHVIKLISFYLTMVGAHLLGRFAWHYQEKLNWDAL